MNTKKDIIDLFSAPGAEYRGKPFWSWNGELKKEELIRQLSVIKEMGFGGFFMHSRAGLITEYLGDEWFELINAVADEGEKLGLEAWLYDEDRWPSGSAGGKVTVDEQYRMKSIVLNAYESDKFDYDKDTKDYEVINIFAAHTDGRNLYEYAEYKDKDALAKALAGNSGYNKVLVFKIVPDAPQSVYNGTTYIDTMSRKAVDRFIEITHEEYRKRCGDRFGRSIKGIFTDEPHRGHMLDDYKVVDGVEKSSAAYTDDIFDEFSKRYGYDLKAILPELFYIRDGRRIAKVKTDFVDLGNNLFIERFAVPVQEWCEKNNLIFTGHVLHEDALINQTVPNGSLMRFYPYMGYPGIDLLTEHNRCFWVAKQLSSATRQTGQKWLLSELYGCTGWQFDFKAHKAVGDWQALLGINLRCPHLSWYTMEGESKRDYPASIFHQSSYYKDYDYVETYFARFGAIMTQGKELCDILVLNPIESVWGGMYLDWANWISPAPDNDKEVEIETKYKELFHMLMDNQLDFDYGEEFMMITMSSIGKDEDGRAVLKVGKASYHTAVVGGMLTMRKTTVDILRRFMDEGGKVVFTGEIPEYVDSEPSDEAIKLSEHENAIVVPFDGKALADTLKGITAFRAGVSGDSANEIFVQTRYDAETDLIYAIVLNTNRDKKTNDLTLTLEGNKALTDGRFAEEWDFATGKRYKQEMTYKNGVPTVIFDMEAAGERLFVFTKNEDTSIEERVSYQKESQTKFADDSEFEYELDEKNVCVLDFAKWKFNGGEWNKEDEVLHVDGKIRDHVGIERRGGEMLQPWYSKANCNDEYGKLELEYEFYADVVPEGDLFIALERPELWECSLNGTRLECKDPDDFWIDICFSKMHVPAGLIQKGRNVVTCKTLFRRTTNVESIYLVGDFGVRIDGHKRTLDTRPSKIGFRNLIEYNMPFYTGCVTYKIPASELAKHVGANKIFLRTDGYRGSLVKVCAVGDGCEENEQVLAWDPYRADITEWVKSGKDVGVTLVCSRRNMFGPLHQLPIETTAYGPGNFVTSGPAWSDDYKLINSAVYGITIEERHLV